MKNFIIDIMALFGIFILTSMFLIQFEVIEIEQKNSCRLYGEVRTYRNSIKFKKNEMVVNEIKIPEQDQRIIFQCNCEIVDQDKITLCEIKPTIYKKEK